MPSLRCLLVIGAVFLLPRVLVPAQAMALNDSGQIRCYSAQGTNDDPGIEVSTDDPTPEPDGFEGQDCTSGAAAADALGLMHKVGASAVPGRDYSKIANDGSDLGTTGSRGTAASDWGCTRDNISGLIWELKVDGPDPDAADPGVLRDSRHLYSWYVADEAINGGNPGHPSPAEPDQDSCHGTLSDCNISAYRDAVNAAGLCGANDWRLPSVHELHSLLRYSADGGSLNQIDLTWFPDNLPSASGVGMYWSAQPQASNSAHAWGIDFQFGNVHGYSKDYPNLIRLVRGGAQ